MTGTGHNSRAETLRAAARFVLACDQEVADVNDRKKEFYKALKRSVGEDDIAALKDAIKLHRRKLRQEDVEGHDSRVWEVLGFIEGQNGLGSEDLAVRATRTQSRGQSDETAPTRTRAAREAVKKQAMRHSMEDHIALSEELAALPPEAAEENRVIAEAMNRKSGDGKPLDVVDPETGEIIDPHSAVPSRSADSAEFPPAHSGGVSPEAPPLDANDAGDIPPFLRRTAA